MMKPSLQLRIGQQLTMTPQLQQAIRLLQLPTIELQAQVLQALENNVMLEPEEDFEATWSSETAPSEPAQDAGPDEPVVEIGDEWTEPTAAESDTPWSGSGDGGTLTSAETGEGRFALPPERLMSGFYLNELLLRLLPKEDRHEALYDAYAAALRQLAGGAEQAALRGFESVLLEELGYGVDLARDAGSGRPLESERYYQFEPGRGVIAVCDAESAADAYSGRDVLGVAHGEFREALAIEFDACGAGRIGDEQLLADRHDGPGAGTETVGVHRHIAPAEHRQSLVHDDRVDRFLCLLRVGDIERQERQTNRVRAGGRQFEAGDRALGAVLALGVARGA